MTSCLLVGAAMLTLAAPEFTLSWTHSVEKQQWVETWLIDGQNLILTRVAIKGSGAGMEPAADAKLENGWWVWAPKTTLPGLSLAASGATGSGWDLCSGATCTEIGATASGPISITPCNLTP